MVMLTPAVVRSSPQVLHDPTALSAVCCSCRGAICFLLCWEGHRRCVRVVCVCVCVGVGVGVVSVSVSVSV